MRPESGGLLADAIDAAMRDLPETLMRVVATDTWDTRAYARIRAECHAQAISWLPVRAELGHLIIGPLETPGERGCVECARLRCRRAHEEPKGHEAVLERHEQALASVPSAWLTPQAAELAGALVAEEVRGFGRTRTAFLSIDLETLHVETHTFLPDPQCVVCGGLPDDSAERASISLTSRPKFTPDGYRVRSAHPLADDLVATYVDPRSGLIREIPSRGDAGTVVASAPLRLPDLTVVYGSGRTRSYRSSRMVALFEALERLGGMAPGGKRTVVEACYRELGPSAIDPRTLGTHPAETYEDPASNLRPFDETAAYPWVWAYSFARRTPVLVPESYAYYRTGGANPFIFESSNGCAIGHCLEEAILYGILEVAERDAFLMTWYARMPMPRIDLDSAKDRTIPLVAEAIRAETGYTAMAFDTTMEHGIPCVWAMAVRPQADTGRPMAVCAAGAHVNPEQAAVSALNELSPLIGDLGRRFPPARDRARRMADDPTLITSMPDHSLAYGEAKAFHRLAFLTGSTRVRRFSGMAQPTAFRNDDLRQDLEELIGRYLDSGLDVIVVDQTTPEHQACGAVCVKVIIPGMLPMTFGHAHRRVDGLPRLSSVPPLLGYHPQDINPYPHPFA